MEKDEASKRNRFTALSLLKVYKKGLQYPYQPGLTFQQDNAPIYTALSAREWLESYGIWTMEWPPYSPDLNPIEHVWWAPKKRVLEAYSNLATEGKSEEARIHLIKACKEQ